MSDRYYRKALYLRHFITVKEGERPNDLVGFFQKYTSQNPFYASQISVSSLLKCKQSPKYLLVWGFRCLGVRCLLKKIYKRFADGLPTKVSELVLSNFFRYTFVNKQRCFVI